MKLKNVEKFKLISGATEIQIENPNIFPRNKISWNQQLQIILNVINKLKYNRKSFGIKMCIFLMFNLLCVPINEVPDPGKGAQNRQIANLSASV